MMNCSECSYCDGERGFYICLWASHCGDSCNNCVIVDDIVRCRPGLEGQFPEPPSTCPLFCDYIEVTA